MKIEAFYQRRNMDIVILQNENEFRYENLFQDHIIENDKEHGHLYVYELDDEGSISHLVAAFSHWDCFLIEEPNNFFIDRNERI